MSIIPCTLEQRDSTLRHRFRLDRGLPVELRNFLSFRGAEVDLEETYQRKSSEPRALLAAAIRDQRVLVTFEHGPWRLPSDKRAKRAGVVVLRLGDRGWAAVERAVLRLLDRFEPGTLAGAVTQVGEAAIERQQPVSAGRE